MFIIDRFEEGVAVLCDDNSGIYMVPRAILPINAKEGDVVRLTTALDRRATAVRRRAAKNALRGFFEK